MFQQNGSLVDANAVAQILTMLSRESDLANRCYQIVSNNQQLYGMVCDYTEALLRNGNGSQQSVDAAYRDAALLICSYIATQVEPNMYNFLSNGDRQLVERYAGHAVELTNQLYGNQNQGFGNNGFGNQNQGFGGNGFANNGFGNNGFGNQNQGGGFGGAAWGVGGGVGMSQRGSSFGGQNNNNTFDSRVGNNAFKTNGQQQQRQSEPQVDQNDWAAKTRNRGAWEKVQVATKQEAEPAQVNVSFNSPTTVDQNKVLDVTDWKKHRTSPDWVVGYDADSFKKRWHFNGVSVDQQLVEDNPMDMQYDDFVIPGSIKNNIQISNTGQLLEITAKDKAVINAEMSTVALVKADGSTITDPDIVDKKLFSQLPLSTLRVFERYEGYPDFRSARNNAINLLGREQSRDVRTHHFMRPYTMVESYPTADNAALIDVLTEVMPTAVVKSVEQLFKPYRTIMKLHPEIGHALNKRATNIINEAITVPFGMNFTIDSFVDDYKDVPGYILKKYGEQIHEHWMSYARILTLRLAPVELIRYHLYEDGGYSANPIMPIESDRQRVTPFVLTDNLLLSMDDGDIGVMITDPVYEYCVPIGVAELSIAAEDNVFLVTEDYMSRFHGMIKRMIDESLRVRDVNGNHILFSKYRLVTADMTMFDVHLNPMDSGNDSYVVKMTRL